MSAPRVATQSYGKSRVRLSHIHRDGDRHEFIELCCTIKLTGDFDAAYTGADNSLVVPTDTMKNTVYALAGRHGVRSAETFARRLASHFVDSYSQVRAAAITVEQSPWRRMGFSGEPHPHAFRSGGGEINTVSVSVHDDPSAPGPLGRLVAQTCGLKGLKVLKTTGSAFTKFHTDDLTTLQPVDDRIFATTIEAVWDCPDPDADWPAIRETVRQQLLTVFANEHSESVQHTLYSMGEATLAACPQINAITLSMPNQHHLLVNLEPFDLDNPNRVFVPTDEPFGDISATIVRGETSCA